MQFLLDWDIGLVVFGADWHNIKYTLSTRCI